MKKIIIFCLMIFFLISNVYSNECSREIPCNCGDTLIESKELSIFDNLNFCMTPYVLKINSDNISISCFETSIKSGHVNPITPAILVNGNNFSIFNCEISGFYNAIEIKNSNNGLIFNNSLNNNFASGIELENSNNYNIFENKIINNSWDGIFLISSSNNNISNNTINYNKIDGIQIFFGSFNNYIYNNNLKNNLGHAIAPITCNNKIVDISNIGGDGKPIKYIENRNNIEIKNSNEFSEIIFCNVSDSIISNIKISNPTFNNDGILFVGSDNNIVENSNLSNLRAGIYFYDSYNNKIINNYFSNNQYGLRFMTSTNNYVYNNHFDFNEIFFHFNNSNNNILLDNIFYDYQIQINYSGFVQIYSGDNGIINYFGEINIEETNIQKKSLNISFLKILGFLLIISLISTIFIIFLKKKKN